MITMAHVSAGAAGREYYDRDGYYTPGSDEARAASEWFGKAAAAEGLVGEIDSDRFAEVLTGKAPDGQVLGVMRGGEWQHRPGLDITVSAPKEVSVLALVFGDERVRPAHDQVTREVAGYIEDKLMMTRVAHNGEIEVERAPNVVAGLFRHDTSPALDPHLHTHIVFANMVKTDLRDRYRTIHSDVLVANTLVLTQFYHSRMNVLLNELGYESTLNLEGQARTPLGSRRPGECP